MSNPKQSYSTTATAAYDAVYYSHEIALLLQSQLCIKMLRVGRFDYNTLLLLRKDNFILPPAPQKTLPQQECGQIRGEPGGARTLDTKLKRLVL